MSLFKLDNVIQHYPWGSKQSISELFDIQNPNAEPQAEIWMGAHPRGCSRVADTGQLLSEVLSQDSKGMFGEYTEARFGELPYLFKVLAAETPLSIQVHPSKKKAQLGFERENKLGISLDASNRNYKDPNHKPELVYALTFYKAMNGFRPIQQIIELFKEAEISALDIEISALAINPNSEGLKVFFTSVMTLEGERKKLALEQLYSAYERRPKTAMGREALQYSKGFEQHYVDDIGLFSPLMLNTIELAPGEAMFLHAETPHAYIEGTGLEIMANSDNVLRAGLTPKFIDVPELIDNTCFETTDIEGIKLKPIEKEDKLSFPIPVDDFGFDILSVSEEISQQYLRSAEILFCIGGEVTISTKEHKLMLSSGESVFISNDAGMYEYQGQGILARAYN
ncbi:MULTISPECIES: mannose-6-phosphate isomerase, class I [Vibrio]|uniref:mannose-6-phosphate isomerase, class I n=1 Tax=Vibrio TaxID=662 RepID=UPI000D3B09B5|nr:MULTISPECIES: mannose-6-phosphate isomerase, class I [Vibrio]PTO71045.1 mannose-6-phosphate isomerase, class I [Vibrio splendidus]PTO89435.1 mannose-6-phosphate isomerase, class I [Vibrio splendidus]PTP28424.1 mannose-6-phosphate isomerase, class I [Vibrio splendidus]PTP49882.1 mannose-6-phosphate isomerase, class I [Vibrio splendidus]PTP95432.1 mannose-6-phosphate isomerase, class I [Vibrio splendidus]